MTGVRRWLAVAAAATAAVALTGCGSAASPGSSQQAPAVSLPSLATSAVSQDGTSWAVLQMGGAASREENFWQLFARPQGTTSWRLATPAGVADNGGLVIAPTGAQSALTGFRPSQDLKFSPLAATANGGRDWSATGPVQPGLSDVARGLAAGPSGKLIALTTAGAATSGDSGATWTSLISRAALAAGAAARTCGLTTITAAAFSVGGSPMLAGACRRPGTAGIFELSPTGWRQIGPALPSAFGAAQTRVLALATTGSTTTAVLAAGSGRRGRLVTAWLTGGTWTLSAVLPALGLVPTSVSFWPGAAVGLVLPGRRGAVLSPPTKAQPHGGWQLIALPLPVNTGTLASGPSGQIEALAADRSLFSVWRLAVSGQPARWQRVQALKVAIPYGSSS